MTNRIQAQQTGPIMKALLKRRSVRPRKLIEPAPTPVQLALLLKAAMNAPDHGGLKPWRFLVIQGRAREALGQRMVNCYKIRHPEADEQTLARQRDKAAAKAPMLIGLIAHIQHHEGIPAAEQRHAVMMAGAYLMLAADEMGFGTILLSGDHVADRRLCQHLGLAENEQLLGWINIGTPKERPPAHEPADVQEFLRWWQG